jgi:hypothetical protein
MHVIKEGMCLPFRAAVPVLITPEPRIENINDRMKNKLIKFNFYHSLNVSFANFSCSVRSS